MAASLLNLTTGQPPTTGTSGYNAMSSAYPNLTATQGQASQNILAQLQGQLSPGTINTIQDEAARFGVNSGIPMSTLSGSRGLSRLGLTSENQQNQGLQNFLNTLKGYAGTVTPTTGENISLQLGRGDLALRSQQLAQQAEQFRQSQAQQLAEFGGNLGLGYAGLGPSYLNSASSYLNFLK